MTISAACKKAEYRQRFVEDQDPKDDFLSILLS